MWGVEHRIPEDGHARDWPDDLLEQLQLLAAQFREIKKHARDVAAWLRQVTHEAHCHGIALQINRNGGNVAGRVLGSRQRRRPSNEEDIHVEPNEVGRELG